MSTLANHPECKECEGNYKGKCKMLNDTRWSKPCPFVATPERLKRDKELLERAIAEGRIKIG